MEANDILWFEVIAIHLLKPFPPPPHPSSPQKSSNSLKRLFQGKAKLGELLGNLLSVVSLKKRM